MQDFSLIALHILWLWLLQSSFLFVLKYRLMPMSGHDGVIWSDNPLPLYLKRDKNDYCLRYMNMLSYTFLGVYLCCVFMLSAKQLHIHHIDT